MQFAINPLSVKIQSNLKKNKNDLESSSIKISTGYKINNLSDDPTGSVISFKLSSKINNLIQAKKNMSQNVYLIKTAEGALDQIINILIRMKELSIQALNIGIEDQDRKYLNQEFEILKSTLDRLAHSTKFNEISLLNGDLKDLNFQIGSSNNDKIKINIPKLDTDALGLKDVNLENKQKIKTNINIIDKSIYKISSVKSYIGVMQNKLDQNQKNTSVSIENLMASRSKIKDTDIANEASKLAKNKIILNSNIALLAQANKLPNNALNLIKN